MVRALGAIRGRRVLFAALLLALIAIFVSRGVIHHIADDAAPATAYVQHQAGEHAAEFDVLAVAFALLLFAALLVGSRAAAGTPVRARVGYVAAASPRSPAVSRRSPPPRPADLQCFLT